jgi:anti-sigma B factor antagonist
LAGASVIIDIYLGGRTRAPSARALRAFSPADAGSEATMSFAVEPLKILADITPASTTLHVRGEVDIATAPQFRRELDDHLSRGPSDLRIDLSGVSFMDSSGVHALLVAVRTGHLIGAHVALTGTSPQVDRLLGVVGVALPTIRHPAPAPVTG